VPSNNYAMVVKLDEPKPGTSDLRYVRSYAVNRIDGSNGLPLLKPPYGRITAIDLNTGEHKWAVTHGNGIRNKLIKAGITNPGPTGGWGTGPLLTPSLLFLAQDDDGKFLLRRLPAELELPASPGGTPMAYTIGNRQYIALATGSGKNAGLVALTLPVR
jgi:quinoprotein glucose dehydrogenase